MTLYLTAACDCPDIKTGTGGKRPKECDCGNRYVTEAEVRNAGLVGGKSGAGYPMQHQPTGLSRHQPAAASTPRRRSKPLRKGKGFSASKEQRDKVKLLPCAYCGVDKDEAHLIDPAHVWPRGKGGCDHPDCVVPLCRNGFGEGCHRAFDDGKLELLPSLITRGYFAEMAHPIACHEVSPTVLVERLTGEPYGPTAGLVRELQMAQGRIVELEAHIHA